MPSSVYCTVLDKTTGFVPIVCHVCLSIWDDCHVVLIYGTAQMQHYTNACVGMVAHVYASIRDGSGIFRRESQSNGYVIYLYALQ